MKSKKPEPPETGDQTADEWLTAYLIIECRALNFAFRYNLKSLRSPGLLFRLLARNAATVRFYGSDHVAQDTATELTFPDWIRASGALSAKAGGPFFSPIQPIGGEK